MVQMFGLLNSTSDRVEERPWMLESPGSWIWGPGSWILAPPPLTLSCLEILLSLLGTNEQQQQIWQKPREQADERVPESPRLPGTMAGAGSWRCSLVQVSGPVLVPASWFLVPNADLGSGGSRGAGMQRSPLFLCSDGEPSLLLLPPPGLVPSVGLSCWTRFYGYGA